MITDKARRADQLKDGEFCAVVYQVLEALSSESTKGCEQVSWTLQPVSGAPVGQE